MENVPDSIYFKDLESRFTRINRYAASGTALRARRTAIGRTDFDFFTDEHAAQARRDEQEIIRTGQPLVNVEEKETLPDGQVRWVSTTKLPLRDRVGNIVGTFGISRDITHRKTAEEQLQHRAFYDPLTDLPNRALFLDRLQHLLQPRRGARWVTRRSRCCIWTSIASRRSTTAWDTRPATSCWWASPAGCSAASAPATRWRAWAATSSPCCWTTSPASRTRPASPTASTRSSRRR